MFLTLDDLHLLPLVLSMSHHERMVRRATMAHFASHFTEEGIAQQVLEYVSNATHPQVDIQIRAAAVIGDLFKLHQCLLRLAGGWWIPTQATLGPRSDPWTQTGPP